MKSRIMEIFDFMTFKNFLEKYLSTNTVREKFLIFIYTVISVTAIVIITIIMLVTITICIFINVVENPPKIATIVTIITIKMFAITVT